MEQVAVDDTSIQEEIDLERNSRADNESLGQQEYSIFQRILMKSLMQRI